MLKRIALMLSTGAFAVALAWGAAGTSPVYAVSDADLEAQTRVVQHSLVDTLTEYVKLVQLTFIQQLEARVAYLEALQ